MNPLPDPGPRYVMKRIKSDAARAGRDFSLTLDEVKQLIHMPCYYCGIIDMNSLTVKSKVDGRFLVKDYKYNGIDRVDNSVGYVMRNVVPCCNICNRAKNSLHYDDFIGWIDNLIEFRNGIRVSLHGRDDPSRESTNLHKPSG